MTKRIDGTRTGRRVFAVRVNTDTPQTLAQVALGLGFYHLAAGGEKQGAAGQLMDAIADGRIALSLNP